MAGKRTQLRLVSKKINKRTGRRHVSSSSDGIVDYAAAVIVGVMPARGVASIIPDKYHRRAKRLLEKNEVAPVAKKIIPRHAQLRGKIRMDLKAAFPQVIGQVYAAERANVLSTERFFSSKTVIPWIRDSLADPNSRLNHALESAGYHDLVGLERSERWWLDALEIRNKR
jgi:hypothetical protein